MSTLFLDSSTRRGGWFSSWVMDRKVVEVIGTVESNGSITLQYATGFDGDYSMPCVMRYL